MNFALLTNTVVNGGAEAAASSDTAAAASNGISPVLMIVVYCIVIFGIIYLFSIRPQKKKQAVLDKMRKELQPGDPVLLVNGMFGRIVDITAECYIIEFGTNKGVRIPVLKQEVYAKQEPNLTNKAVETPEPEKKGLFGAKKTDDTQEETK